MRDLGIMGGAFSPPHFRHLMIGQAAADQFALEQVLFVPSGTPPHKKTGLLDKEKRFEMTAAAVADNPRFIASRIEIDRPGVTWTIDTLKELRRLYGDDVRLNFIMGEDNIKSIELYDRRTEFLSLCRLLISPRANADPALIATWRQRLPEADLEPIECPSSTMSSTLVRDWVAQGRSIEFLVPAKVNEIIVRDGLYLPPSVPPVPTNSGTPAV